MSNVGRKLKDSFCGGAFGSRYDCEGATVIFEDFFCMVFRFEPSSDTLTEVINFTENFYWTKEGFVKEFLQ